MNLRPRFHLLTILLFVAAAIPGWLAVQAVVDGIVAQWAVRYAERQVLYDKSRMLQPILREVALARALAESPVIRKWARQPDDPKLARPALAELDDYRRRFQDQNYFIALRKSGRYFYNNAADEFAGREFRYLLSPQAPKDAWFYNLIRQDRRLHLNVNPDPELGITKLWIDVLVKDGGETLGVAGTGLELSAFVRDVVEPDVEGITGLFVDRNGAIQLHRNPSLIDFASITKQGRPQKTLDQLFAQDEDRRQILAAMRGLERGDEKIATRFVTVDGRRHLAGVAYLPEIDWYQITLIDLEVLLPFSQFGGLVALYGLSLVCLLLVFNLALRAFVLKPLAQLEAAIRVLEAGRELPPSVARIGSGEIGRLMQRFAQMAAAVLEAQHGLEAKVRERTVALDRLSKIDPLTELFNRRGMAERLAAELGRGQREGKALGILWLDIDYFKEINDSHGHALGDQVLKQVAAIISATIRSYDVAARWGGDEFLVLVYPTDQQHLDSLGERLRAAIASSRAVLDAKGQPLAMSVSIGGYVATPGEELDHVLQTGDEALYAAKEAGRNAYRAAG